VIGRLCVHHETDSKNTKWKIVHGKLKLKNNLKHGYNHGLAKVFLKFTVKSKTENSLRLKLFKR